MNNNKFSSKATERAVKRGETYRFPIHYLGDDGKFEERLSLLSREAQELQRLSFQRLEENIGNKWTDLNSLIAAPLGAEMFLKCNRVSAQHGGPRFYFDDFKISQQLPDATTRFPYSDDAHLAAKRIQYLLAKNFVLRSNCATRIQRLYRMYIQRCKYLSNIAIFRKAATFIQKFYRFRVERLRRKRTRAIAAYSSAILVQSVVRGFLAKRQVSTIKESRKISLLVNLTLWARKCLKRKRMQRGVNRRLNVHAKRIQRVVRGIQCRTQLRKLHSAQIMIQYAFRRFWKRKYVPMILRLFHALRRAVIYRKAQRIQTIARGFLGRRHAKKKRLRMIAEHWSRNTLELESIRKDLAEFSVDDLRWFGFRSNSEDVSTSLKSNVKGASSKKSGTANRNSGKSKSNNLEKQSSSSAANADEVMAEQIAQLDMMTRLILANKLVPACSRQVSDEPAAARVIELSVQQRLILAALYAFSNRPDGYIDNFGLLAVRAHLRLARSDCPVWMNFCCPKNFSEYQPYESNDFNDELKENKSVASMLSDGVSIVRSRLMESIDKGKVWLQNLSPGRSRREPGDGDIPIGFISTAGQGTRRARFLGKSVPTTLLSSVSSLKPHRYLADINSRVAAVWQRFPEESRKLYEFFTSRARDLPLLRDAPRAWERFVTPYTGIKWERQTALPTENQNPENKAKISEKDEKDSVESDGFPAVNTSDQPPDQSVNSPSPSASLQRSLSSLAAARALKQRRLSGLRSVSSASLPITQQQQQLDEKSLISKLSDDFSDQNLGTSLNVSEEARRIGNLSVDVSSIDEDSVRVPDDRMSPVARSSGSISPSRSVQASLKAIPKKRRPRLTLQQMDELLDELLSSKSSIEVQKLGKIGSDNPPRSYRRPQSVLQQLLGHHPSKPTLFHIRSLVLCNVFECRNPGLLLNVMIRQRLPATMLLQAVMVRRWTKAVRLVVLNAVYRFRSQPGSLLVGSSDASNDIMDDAPNGGTCKNTGPVVTSFRPQKSCPHCGVPISLIPEKSTSIESTAGNTQDVGTLRCTVTTCIRRYSIDWIPREHFHPPETALLLRCDYRRYANNALKKHPALVLFKSRPNVPLEDISEIAKPVTTKDGDKRGSPILSEERSLKDQKENEEMVGLIEEYSSARLEVGIMFEAEKLDDYFNNLYEKPARVNVGSPGDSKPKSTKSSSVKSKSLKVSGKK